MRFEIVLNFFDLLILLNFFLFYNLIWGLTYLKDWIFLYFFAIDSKLLFVESYLIFITPQTICRRGKSSFGGGFVHCIVYSQRSIRLYFWVVDPSKRQTKVWIGLNSICCEFVFIFVVGLMLYCCYCD